MPRWRYTITSGSFRTGTVTAENAVAAESEALAACGRTREDSRVYVSRVLEAEDVRRHARQVLGLDTGDE